MPNILRVLLGDFWIGYYLGIWSIMHQLEQLPLIAFYAFIQMGRSFVNTARVWWASGIAPSIKDGFMFPGNITLTRKVIHLAVGLARMLSLSIMFVIGMLIYCVASTATGITFWTIAIAIGVTAYLTLSILFIPWLAFYKYPMFEFVYPRVRRKILLQNSYVYNTLPEDPSSVRVVRLRPGNPNDKIQCDFVTGPLQNMDFEALSYAWGVTLIPYTTYVDGRPFLVTYNLYCALKNLRYSNRERLLWIDAMCINQHDNTEKGSQVQMMRDIYAQASKVVVWLGKATKATVATFEFVRQFNDTDLDGRVVFWTTETSTLSWHQKTREFKRILGNEWWGRAWIVQEVVKGRDVVVQRGAYEIAWEALHTMLTYPSFADNEFNNSGAPEFAKDVQGLRIEELADEPTSITLQDLVFKFRHQAATFGSDKIYAFLGLLEAGNPSLIVPDYNKNTAQVFLELAVSCLVNNKDLAILSVAKGVELQSISWCRDWRSTRDSFYPPVPLTALSQCVGARPFAASSHHHGPIFTADLEHHILALQGYHVDTVEKISNPLLSSFHFGLGLTFGEWEGIAWPLLERAAFERTITADRWTAEPVEWRGRLTFPLSRSAGGRGDAEYKVVAENACYNRAFFVTKGGRYGLGPWDLRKGDEVCILSGGKTPFILRKAEDMVSRKKSSLADLEPKGCYRFVGEAYVHGLMYYEEGLGSLEASGEASREWFCLV